MVIIEYRLLWNKQNLNVMRTLWIANEMADSRHMQMGALDLKPTSIS